MAPLKCEKRGCVKQVEAPDMATYLELLKLHDAQVHSINKPKKPRRPKLAMKGRSGGPGLGVVRVYVRALQDTGRSY